MGAQAGQRCGSASCNALSDSTGGDLHSLTPALSAAHSKTNKTGSQVPARAELRCTAPLKGVVLLIEGVAVHVGVLNMPSTVVAQACSNGRAGGDEQEQWHVWALRQQKLAHPATTANL
jgi:hypothetical protein